MTKIHMLGSQFINFYLVEDDDGVTVVDAGCRKYLPRLASALADIGRTMDDLRAVVVTHAHPDHVGFAPDLGIPVYIHEADRERARTGRPETGSPLAMLGMLRHRYARRLTRHLITAGGLRQAPIPDAVTFTDGTALPIPGRLRVVATPGHTPGHSAFYAPDADAVFVGDALANLDMWTGRPGVTLSHTSSAPDQARESLAAIARTGARTVYFGHGAPSTISAEDVVAQALGSAL
jgi:glyoxylase-like metal-dependent hydrolase (beta-lactamase superfamily II)